MGFCNIHIPEQVVVPFKREVIFGQTMATCEIHGWTNFVLVDGKKVRVCKKCQDEKKLEEYDFD